MGVRNIGDYLASGEAGNLLLSGNIGYLVAQDPSYDGMFMRLQGGVTSLYRAPDQDVHWTDEDSTEVLLTTTANSLLSVTTDMDLTSADGSYRITGIASNSTNQDVTMTVTVKDDGVVIGSRPIDLVKEETTKQFVFSGSLDDPIASGSVLTVEFIASKANAITLNGTNSPTKIDLTKAQAAPVVFDDDAVSAYLSTPDGMSDIGTVTYDTLADLGNTLSVAEIEAVLTSFSVPAYTRDMSFYIKDSSDTSFAVHYTYSSDSYQYEKLSNAT